ncbi:DUF5722 domain-containing protein [Cohnella sp. GCM10012308]|uniref:DUF5722 domain-containing protein n=1 Tax=Cohnella sp. GCM10012308 TaxID=3317329 RepID=UPI00362254AE
MTKMRWATAGLALALAVGSVTPWFGRTAAAAGAVVSPVPCVSAGVGGINGITATSTEIVAEGWTRTSAVQNLQLFALEPYEDPSAPVLGSKSPLVSQAVGSGTAEACYAFTIRADRFDPAGKDLIYDRFAVALRSGSGTLTPVDAKYVTTFSGVAASNEAFPVSATKKGLQVQLIDDAQELGIGHAALNFDYGNILRPAASSGTITYAMDGENFYIDKDTIEAFDRDVKSLSDNGIVVSLILLIYPNGITAPSNLMLHPDNNGGTVGAFNTKDANSKYFKAVTEFIVKRYTRTDRQYGRAVNFIVGNEVNTHTGWYNMGAKTLQEFVKDYVRTLRIVHTAAQKAYSNARVYVSLDHLWTVADSAGNFQGKQLLDELNAQAAAAGNFPWNVAYHPYPENIFVPSTWNDTTATDSFNTQKITFKNIQVLTQYLNQPQYQYNNAQRHLILSEQGFHSADANDPGDQRVQAAAYAYAYYKALFNDGIDSFILHRHVDNKFESGLNLGIWTGNAASAIANEPAAKKKIWNVMKWIDTSESANVSDFAKLVIGVSDWSEIIPGFDATRLNVRTPETTTKLAPITATSGSNLSIANFNTDQEGWQPADYTNQAARATVSANAPGTPYAGSGMLQASFDTSLAAHGAAGWKGLVKTFGTPLDLSSTPYFYLAVNAFGGATGATKYEVKVRLYSGDRIVEGLSAITPDSWNRLGLDVSRWPGRQSVDKIKVWFRANSGAVWNAGFQIDELGAAAAVSYRRVGEEFNTDGNSEGWVAENHITGLAVSGGYLQGTLGGTDPFVTRYGIAENAAVNQRFVIRMKNATTATKGKLYWTTQSDGTRSESKSRTFDIVPNDNQYREYAIDLSGTSTWANTITQLRVDPSDNGSGTGSFSIDYIRLGSAADLHWDFQTNGDLTGWNTANDMTVAVSGGVMQQTITGTDPFIYTPDNLGLAADAHRVILVRMQNGTSATQAKIYWTRTTDTGASELRQKTFTVVPFDAAARVYAIRMDDEPLWNGTVRQLRFDLSNNGAGTGTIAVDYVSLPSVYEPASQ